MLVIELIYAVAKASFRIACISVCVFCFELFICSSSSSQIAKSFSICFTISYCSVIDGSGINSELKFAIDIPPIMPPTKFLICL